MQGEKGGEDMDSGKRWELIDRLLDLAVAEDVGEGDITTESLVAEDAQLTGSFVSRQSGVFAGLEIIQHFYERLDQRITMTGIATDGQHIAPGQKLAEVKGPARPILTGERIALNILQRMCGVATLTKSYVEAIHGTNAKIYDTRKTMPGMRILDKLAVYTGGGENHRQGLFDMILIKDNHLALSYPECPQDSAACSVERVRSKTNHKIMIEVDSLDQLRDVVDAEPDFVLLDNMDIEMLVEAVHITRRLCADRGLRRPLLEASGGITLKNIKAIAEAGVDRISIGAITHSAPALDIGLDYAG